MKKNLPYILIGLLLVAGLAVLFYPSISNWQNDLYQGEVIVDYDHSADATSDEAMERELQRARDYNDHLTGQGITDPFIPGGGLVLPENYASILDISNGAMGYIIIPRIDVELPIYHGTSARVLGKGIGHMEMTAFPIGGIGNHSVLTGHSALPNATLFTDLDKLVEGDRFYIKVFKETYAYQVDETQVVEPDNTTPLIPDPELDAVSLVTCTPYAINSHRLLVHGMRIPYTPGEEHSSENQPDGSTLLTGHYDLIIALIALIVVLASIIRALVRRRKHSMRGHENSLD